jgi:hypothetical protein
MDILVPHKQETIDWWKALLREEELVDRSIMIYSDEIHTPSLAIPLGTHRRTGYISCFYDHEYARMVFRKLQERPLGFPNLRWVSNPVYRDRAAEEISEIAWGDDVTDLWLARNRPGTLAGDTHRALGRAFGYKEERIQEMYPPNWQRGDF